MIREFIFLLPLLLIVNADVVVQSASSTVSENGATVDINLVLDSRPTSLVHIEFSSSDLTKGTLSLDDTTFTLSNWNITQTLVLQAVDNNIADGDTTFQIVFGPVSSTDSSYNGLNISSLNFTSIDDDVAGVTVSNTTLYSWESGISSSSVSFSLTSEPVANVQIALSLDDSTQSSLSSSVITASPTNWNLAQTVTVIAINDMIDDGAHISTISLAIASADSIYDVMSLPTISVTSIDDDSAGVQVSTYRLDTTEAGGTDTTSIVLTSEPLATVDIRITREAIPTTAPECYISSSSALSSSPSAITLQFSPANWNIAQTVQVTGIDDWEDDGDKEQTLSIAVSSSDSLYSSQTVSPIVVTNADDDSFGVVISDTTSLITNEGGTLTPSFDLILSSRPYDNVNIDCISSDTDEGLVLNGSISFSNGNWNRTQQIYLTGVDDNIIDGDVVYSISCSVHSVGDANYSSIGMLDPLSVTNQDDPPELFGVVTAMDGSSTTVTGSHTAIKAKSSASISGKYFSSNDRYEFIPRGGECSLPIYNNTELVTIGGTAVSYFSSTLVRVSMASLQAGVDYDFCYYSYNLHTSQVRLTLQTIAQPWVSVNTISTSMLTAGPAFISTADENGNSVSVTISSGSLSSAETISITLGPRSTQAEQDLQTSAQLASAVSLRSDVWEMTPHGVVFDKCVTIHIPYTAVDSSDYLALYHGSYNVSDWTRYTASSVTFGTTTYDYVEACVSHFSVFAVVAMDDPPTSSSSSSPSETNVGVIVGPIVAVLGVGGGTFLFLYFWRKRNAKERAAQGAEQQRNGRVKSDDRVQKLKKADTRDSVTDITIDIDGNGNGTEAGSEAVSKEDPLSSLLTSWGRNNTFSNIAKTTVEGETEEGEGECEGEGERAGGNEEQGNNENDNTKSSRGRNSRRHRSRSRNRSRSRSRSTSRERYRDRDRDSRRKHRGRSRSRYRRRRSYSTSRSRSRSRSRSTSREKRYGSSSRDKYRDRDRDRGRSSRHRRQKSYRSSRDKNSKRLRRHKTSYRSSKNSSSRHSKRGRLKHAQSNPASKALQHTVSLPGSPVHTSTAISTKYTFGDNDGSETIQVRSEKWRKFKRKTESFLDLTAELSP